MELLAALKDVHKNDWDIDFYVYLKEEIEIRSSMKNDIFVITHF